MSKFIYILDPGHGGINPTTGQYVTAGKRSPKWADGTIYYEGVGNREIVSAVAAKLKQLNIRHAFTVAPDDWKDVGLTQRCNTANKIHTANSKKAILISIHSNAASSSQANGFEVFTSPGQTKSDEYAEIWYHQMLAEFPELNPRYDKRDGDHDKEDVFTMLTKTSCPAFLIESMFHTNEKECRILMSERGKIRIADTIVRTIQKIEKDEGKY